MSYDNNFAKTWNDHFDKSWDDHDKSWTHSHVDFDKHWNEVDKQMKFTKMWFIFIAGIFILLLLISVCWRCCCLRKRKEGTIINSSAGDIENAPVVVTSTTHTAPGGYPVTQLPPQGGYPVTQMQAPMGYQTNMYAAPYPMHTGATGQMGMQMPMPNMQPPAPGVHQHMAPYPPMSANAAANMNPPSYDMAVAGSSAGQPNQSSSGFEKQSPYNPSFTAH